MPHRIAGRKLNRPHAHRVSMLVNLAVSVIRYEKVKTTEAKAKEVRCMVDGLITLAKRGDLHARRQLVSKMPHEPLIVDKLINELAGKYAEQQRVAVARALANRPPLVLADEPTGNLDEHTADVVLAEFLSLVRGEGSAALVATHNERLARKMDRVVRLHDGRLEELGPKAG